MKLIIELSITLSSCMCLNYVALPPDDFHLSSIIRGYKNQSDYDSAFFTTMNITLIIIYLNMNV